MENHTHVMAFCHTSSRWDCGCGKVVSVEYSTGRKGLSDKSSIISWRPFQSTMWHTHNMFDANNLCAVLGGFWEVDTGASKGSSLKVNKYLVCITLAAFNDLADQSLAVWQCSCSLMVWSYHNKNWSVVSGEGMYVRWLLAIRCQREILEGAKCDIN